MLKKKQGVFVKLWKMFYYIKIAYFAPVFAELTVRKMLVIAEKAPPCAWAVHPFIGEKNHLLAAEQKTVPADQARFLSAAATWAVISAKTGKFQQENPLF